MADKRIVNVALLDALTDAFNRHDVDAVVSFFADDGVFVMARGPEPTVGRRCVGKQQIHDVLSGRFEIIADMRWEDAKHWVIGDKALSEWTVKGTPADGSPPLDFAGCDLYEFRDGLIVKKDTYWKYVT